MKEKKYENGKKEILKVQMKIDINDKRKKEKKKERKKEKKEERKKGAEIQSTDRYKTMISSKQRCYKIDR